MGEETQGFGMEGASQSPGKPPRGPTAFQFQAALLCNDAPLPASWRDQWGSGKTACSRVASLAGHFDQPCGKGPQQCPALGRQLTLLFSPPSLLLVFSGQVVSNSL